jgi:hypothetical protein
MTKISLLQESAGDRKQCLKPILLSSIILDAKNAGSHLTEGVCPINQLVTQLKFNALQPTSQAENYPAASAVRERTTLLPMRYDGCRLAEF